MDDLYLLLGKAALALGVLRQELIICLVSAAIGALMLTRFTPILGPFAYPVNFAALLAGGIAANRLMRGMHLPFDPTFERPAIFAVAGMTVAAIGLFFLLRRGSVAAD